MAGHDAATPMPEFAPDALLLRLIEAHPLLFQDEAPLVFSYVSPGWYALIDKLCSDIESVLGPEACSSFRVEQIKEKFGALRFYWRLKEHNEVPPDADKLTRLRQLVDEACDRSRTACEQCGAPARLRKSAGWLTTLCDAHD